MRHVVTAALFLIASSRCAVYDNGLTSGKADGPQGGEGTSGDSAEGGKLHPGGASTASGTASGGRQNGGTTGVAGTSGDVEPGGAGTGGAEGGEPSEGGQGPSDGGQGPSAGGGGAGGGGAGATGGMAGIAGMTGVEALLSQGKPATSDSEQTAQNHLATHANDGDTTTRWCAANSSLNHYWQVDLGQSHPLTKVHLLWEKDFAYLFKIETSTDEANWTMVVDKTTSSSASASQDHALPANTNGRYVRLTVTGGLQATTWASLYEVHIFGY